MKEAGSTGVGVGRGVGGRPRGGSGWEHGALMKSPGVLTCDWRTAQGGGPRAGSREQSRAGGGGESGPRRNAAPAAAGQRAPWGRPTVAVTAVAAGTPQQSPRAAARTKQALWRDRRRPHRAGGRARQAGHGGQGDPGGPRGPAAKG